MRIPTRSGTTSRGQAAVEFALVLSLLILLLVLAVDMGRAFFGSVGLHNVARIAASEASARPDAWEPPGSAADQTAYRQTVLEDLQAIGCERPGGGAFTAADVPDPVFENKAATSFSSDIYEVGDHVSVYLECDLQPITPIASAILGGDVSIAAQAEFPVRGGQINGVPIGGAPPPTGCVDKTVPNLVGLAVADARTAWTNAQFTGAFTPATGDDTNVVTSQTTTPASVPGDCRPATTSVLVAHTAPGPCSGTDIQVPSLVNLTVSQARSSWTAAGFDAGTFSPASGSDANIVDGQTTSPSSSPGDCRPPDHDRNGDAHARLRRRSARCRSSSA